MREQSASQQSGSPLSSGDASSSDHPQVRMTGSFGIATYPPGATFGPRRMNDWEFVWLREGDAEYSWNTITIAAPQNSVVLCRPGATDFFRWDAGRRTRHAFFHFDVESLPALWPPQEAWPLVLQPPEDDLMLPLFRHVLRALRNAGRHVDTPEIRLAVAHILTLWVRGAGDSSDFAPERWPDAVERTWDYIHKKLEADADANINLGDLARASHTTPEHLCRVFKISTGWTPMEAVRLARLDRAATLLARSNYSINEIARMCGFASAFHFSRRFRDAFGQSPREVRNNIKNGERPPLPRLLRHL